MTQPWISLIGIGEDGLDGLSPPARRALMQASCVIGGARHLALVGTMQAKTLVWPSPIEAILPELLARRGQDVAVLASGDPFCYGVGTLLARHVGKDEIRSFPQPSAFALAANYLGLSQQHCRMVSLHGRPLEGVIPHLQPGHDVLALSWDGETPLRLAQLLCRLGCGASRLTVLEALGGPRERVRMAEAQDFDLDDIQPLNLVHMHVVAGRDHRLMPLSSGLPDAFFAHDGQITKRDVRAMTLARLMPFAGELLWDIGAGTGSVAIEWLLRHPSMRAVAVEQDAAKIQRITHNADMLGVPQLDIRHGEAPGALASLAVPDAVFIGGGASQAVIAAAVERLRCGGRLLANGVTLETQALLMECHRRQGGEISQIALAQAVPVGRYSGFRAAMPLVQWSWVKP